MIGKKFAVLSFVGAILLASPVMAQSVTCSYQGVHGGYPENIAKSWFFQGGDLRLQMGEEQVQMVLVEQNRVGTFAVDRSEARRVKWQHAIDTQIDSRPGAMEFVYIAPARQLNVSLKASNVAPLVAQYVCR